MQIYSPTLVRAPYKYTYVRCSSVTSGRESFIFIITGVSDMIINIKMEVRVGEGGVEDVSPL